ncbi:MAG: hypothetical protein QXE31_05425 [Candidatus Woesearchaeota archaeon]
MKTITEKIKIPNAFYQVLPYRLLFLLLPTQEIGGYINPEKIIESLAHHSEFGPDREGPGIIVYDASKLPRNYLDERRNPLFDNDGFPFDKTFFKILKERSDEIPIYILQGLHRTITAIEQRTDMPYFSICSQDTLNYFLKILKGESESPDKWNYDERTSRIKELFPNYKKLNILPFKKFLEEVEALHKNVGEPTIEDFIEEYNQRFKRRF